MALFSLSFTNFAVTNALYLVELTQTVNESQLHRNIFVFTHLQDILLPLKLNLFNILKEVKTNFMLRSVLQKRLSNCRSFISVILE